MRSSKHRNVTPGKEEELFLLLGISISIVIAGKFRKYFIRYREVSTSVGGPHKMLWRAVVCSPLVYKKC